MKISSVLQMPSLVSLRSAHARKTSSMEFSEHFAIQEASASRNTHTASGGDRVSLSTKVSAGGSMENGNVQERTASCGVVSSQAKPYLSADEVSFFEKIMCRSSHASARYGQTFSEIGTSFSVKA